MGRVGELGELSEGEVFGSELMEVGGREGAPSGRRRVVVGLFFSALQHQLLRAEAAGPRL